MRRFLILVAVAALAACSGEPRDLPVADLDCRTGLYRDAAGDMVALTPTTAGGYRITVARPSVNGDGG